jgi:hypothetical protein
LICYVAILSNNSAVVGADLPGSIVIGNNNFIGYNAVVEAKCQDLKHRVRLFLRAIFNKYHALFCTISSKMVRTGDLNLCLSSYSAWYYIEKASITTL